MRMKVVVCEKRERGGGGYLDDDGLDRDLLFGVTVTGCLELCDEGVLLEGEHIVVGEATEVVIQIQPNVLVGVRPQHSVFDSIEAS